MGAGNQLKLLDQMGLFNVPLAASCGRLAVARGRDVLEFVSTNYLGFDRDPALRSRGLEFDEKWGSLAGWSRMELDPAPYAELEARIGGLLGAKRVHLSNTITMTNFSVIPGIVGKGHVFADDVVHAVVWEACRLARDHGAKLSKFRHQDLDHLESLLRAVPRDETKLIAVDGVYSVTSEIADVQALQRLCREYGAWLYVDDAHGFGVLGDSPSHENPYGVGGGGVVRRAGGDYARTFYASSFGKAFCAHTAFVTVPDEYRENLRAFSMQYLFSAPVSPFVLGQVHGALDLNERRGEAARAKLRALGRRFESGLRSLGAEYTNHLLQPVFFVKVGAFEGFTKAAATLEEHGVIAGLRAFPLVREDECGFRFAITALHEPEHVDRALNAIDQALRASKESRAA